MDKIKEFFRKAWASIRENASGVAKQYPYTVGFIYILGMLTLLLLQQIF